MESFVFGKTALGIPIPAFQFGNHGPNVLILGGVHGDEIEGVTAAHGLWGELKLKYDFDFVTTLVPILNLDGVLAKTRTNGNGVDLNRNLPTKDWNPAAFNPRYPPGPHPNSEPENVALTRYLEKANPVFVLSLHSWKPMLNVNGSCNEEAQAIRKKTGYIIEETIGYPTPGCLGTYAGIERNMPTLTYEIERGLSGPEILKVHVPAIIDGLQATNGKI